MLTRSDARPVADTPALDLPAVRAQAELHHQYLMGLQLMVATNEPAEVVGDWMFRLFRRQHEEKFLSSFNKLGLTGQPDAVACAKYHVIANAMGGVAVEYMEESPRKAWVRFRYPRWMYDGPTLCGIPVQASRGFLRGWYAQNGVSLNNPRLGFVCVSEDMTAQFGLCGYFKEYDHPLKPEERLRFAHHERPPAFDPARQPLPPDQAWNEERLAKANRNYAAEYIRNGIDALAHVVGTDRAQALGSRAARLTGLQHYARMAHAVGAKDGGVTDAAGFLNAMFMGMGDVSVAAGDSNAMQITQSGVRIVRGLEDAAAARLINCWAQLWIGAIHAHRAFLDLTYRWDGSCLHWQLSFR